MSRTFENVYCVIPTYQAGVSWPKFIESIKQQTAVTSDKIIIIDSSSTDNTVALSGESGFNVHIISKETFNHGGTRQLAVSLLPNEADVVVFLTQDALLAFPDSIEKLVSAFDDPSVGCAYGRQLPHHNANMLAIHARLFNYPGSSYVRTLADVSNYGIKTAFLSNSFAAYRISALQLVGGFPDNLILAEDMIVAAKMLQAGYKVAYISDACVRHSHNYTPWQEFKRYFDIGVLHTRERWLLETFGAPNGEGWRFVLSEWGYIFKHAPWLWPLSILNTLMKWSGYNLGKQERFLSLSLKRRVSMVKGYWQ